jgi:CRISPR/Cas system CMR subunit Cmr4 (Cas7 group RAMP superfamily)
MNEATATKKLYEHRRFVFMTLDPVHIGAGGYRLGRVDNTITREPGTNLPKIPGTSLAGAARSYAAMRYGKPAAAGQHKEWQKRKTNARFFTPLAQLLMARIAALAAAVPVQSVWATRICSFSRSTRWRGRCG